MKKHTEKCKVNIKNFAAGNEIPHDCDCDGFHTFDELYEHRISLFIALCRLLRRQENLIGAVPDYPFVWRSKLHHDGTNYEGWFIMGIGQEKGQQISYHLPLGVWNDTDFAQTLINAPEFDGHTSDDVLERLKKI